MYNVLCDGVRHQRPGGHCIDLPDYWWCPGCLIVPDCTGSLHEHSQCRQPDSPVRHHYPAKDSTQDETVQPMHVSQKILPVINSAPCTFQLLKYLKKLVRNRGMKSWLLAGCQTLRCSESSISTASLHQRALLRNAYLTYILTSQTYWLV